MRRQMSYAHPEVLVDTQWVENHMNDAEVRIAEVDYDPTANYNLGHLPSAVLFDWKKDINDPVTRNIFSKLACEDLLRKEPELTTILNWCYMAILITGLPHLHFGLLNTMDSTM